MQIGDLIWVRYGRATRMAYGIMPWPYGLDEVHARVIDITPNGNPVCGIGGVPGLHRFAHGDFAELRADIPDERKPKNKKALSKEAMQAKVDDLMKSSIAGGLRDNVATACIMPLGSQEPSFKSTICHSFMRSGARCLNTYPNIREASGAFTSLKQGVNPERIKAALKSKEPDDVTMRNYLDFLLNDEVLGTFKNKDLEDVLTRGFVSDMDGPQARSMTAVIACRLPFEKFWRVKVWDELVKEGVPPRVALVLQIFVNRLHGEKEKYGVYDICHGHQIFSANMSDVDLRSLNQGTYPPELSLFRKGYNRVNAYWISGEGKTLESMIDSDKSLTSVKKERCPIFGDWETRRTPVAMTYKKAIEKVANLWRKIR